MAAIPSAGVGQSPDEEWLDMRSERTQRIAKEREKRIQDQLVAQTQSDEWIGEYESGDGLGFNVRLLFAPEAGFVYSWHGCLGQYDLNYGGVKWGNGKLTLYPERNNKREGFRGISEEFIPVLWGERHYLIAPDEFIDFTNAVNAGFEPCEPCGRFLLKAGDDDKPVHGLPSIPDEFRPYLLERPINARAISLGRSETEQTSWGTFRTSRLTVDKGSLHGMLNGMELHLLQPKFLSAKVTVKRVEDQSSQVEIEQYDIDDPLPSLDWAFSTRVTPD